MENSMEVLKKLKKELAYDQGIPILAMYLEKTTVPKDYIHPNIHHSTAYSTQDMEAAQMCLDSWVDKEDVVRTHNRLLLSQKKTMTSAATWMNLEIIILCKLTTQRKTNTIWYGLYVKSKKNTNEFIYKIETDSET